MDPLADFAQLQLHFVDQVQWRYEVIRPIVLFDDRTAAQRAVETSTHPETVRKLTRRFRQQGTLGLFPEHTEIFSPSRGQQVPDDVVEELASKHAMRVSNFASWPGSSSISATTALMTKPSKSSGSRAPDRYKASCLSARITAIRSAMTPASR